MREMAQSQLNPTGESFDDKVVRKWHPVLTSGCVPHSEQVEVARTLEGVARSINATSGMGRNARATVLEGVRKMVHLVPDGVPTVSAAKSLLETPVELGRSPRGLGTIGGETLEDRAKARFAPLPPFEEIP